MGDGKYLDLAKSLDLGGKFDNLSGSRYLGIAAEIGRDQRAAELPGSAAEPVGEYLGSVASAMLTPFSYDRASAAMLSVYQNLFGTEAEAQLATKAFELEDKKAQAAGGARDTVGRTLAGMTASMVRGYYSMPEPMRQFVEQGVGTMPPRPEQFGDMMEGLARGASKAAAIESDSKMDNIVSAVTNGVANIGMFVANPVVASVSFFGQGAGGAANEYDQAFVENRMRDKNAGYNENGKYIAALKGGVIESATEWFGGKVAMRLAGSVWGRTANNFISRMNPANKYAVGLGLAYFPEAFEEGLASASYSATRALQGEEMPGWSAGFSEAMRDSFYGGFGGMGAHPLVVSMERRAEKNQRAAISAALRKANGPFSSPQFWEELPRVTIESLRGMTPEQRQAELDGARAAYHSADADRQVGAKILNESAAVVEEMKKNLRRAQATKDAAKIKAAEQALRAAESAADSAFQNQATLAGELLAARARAVTIAAFNAREMPTVTSTTDDVLASHKYTPADVQTDADETAKKEIESIGYRIQFFEPTAENADNPAFYNPATPNVVYLRAGMNDADVATAVGYAYHEVVHAIQATDSDLWNALRSAFDETSVVQAGVEYFNNKTRQDDRLARSAAKQTAAQAGGAAVLPQTVGKMVERRAGSALLRAEGEARVTEDGMRELFRTGKAPGFLGRLIVKMGLRGEQAVTALRLRSMLIEQAAKRGAAPATATMTEFGKQIQEGQAVAKELETLKAGEPAPAPAAAAPTPAAGTAPATPSTGAPPPPSGGAPATAAVPPTPSGGVVTASGLTAAEAAAARTDSFRAMINLVVNKIRKTNKKWAEGRRLYPIAEQMERDPAALSPEDRQIGQEMQAEMKAEFGDEYASLWARRRTTGPIESAKQLVEKAGREAIKDEQKFFRRVWPTLLNQTGRQVKLNPKNFVAAAQRAIADLQVFLKENPKFADYYRKDWKLTRDILSDFLQRKITNDEFMLFRLLSGLNSPNTKLPSNQSDAVNLINWWINNGNFNAFKLGPKPGTGTLVVTKAPVPISGTTANIKLRSIKAVEKLVRRFGSVEAAVNHLTEMVPQKELNAFKKEMGYKGVVSNIGNIRKLVQQATGQSERIPRMFIFGQKVGAYTLNAIGDGRYTTVDIWESRHIRSYFEGMFRKNTGLPVTTAEHDVFTKFNEVFRQEFEKATGRVWEPSALQAVRWFYIIDAARRAGYTAASTNETISVYTERALKRLYGYGGIDQAGGRPGVAASGRGGQQVAAKPAKRAAAAKPALTGSLSARFRAATSAPSETTTSTVLAAKFAARTSGVSDGIKNLINTLNAIIVDRDMAALSPNANPQSVVNAAAGNYVEIYPNVRAKFMYRDEKIILSSKDATGDGKVFAHELMHAATSVRIDEYARQFLAMVSRDENGARTVKSNALGEQYNWTKKSGKAYMDALALASAHPKIDPAMKELIDCFLEAAKSSPSNYEKMTAGEKKRTGYFRFTGLNRVDVVPVQKTLRRFENNGSYTDVPYTSYEVIVRDVNGMDLRVATTWQHQGRIEAEEIASDIRSGKPTNRLNVAFTLFGSGFVEETKMVGGGAVNKGESGDAMSRRGGMYGFGNLHEFIAECANNRAFQDILLRLPSKGRGASVFTRLMNAIRQLLGIPAEQQSMLDDVMRLTEEIATVEMTPAMQSRRQAVPGETAPPAVKTKIASYGFPLLNGISEVMAFEKGRYSIWIKHSVDLFDVTQQPNLALIRNPEEIRVSISKQVDGWVVDSVRSNSLGTLTEYDLADDFAKVQIGRDGFIKGTKSKAAAKIVELAKSLLDSYSADQVNRAQTLSRELNKPIDDQRPLASQSMAARAVPSRSLESFTPEWRAWFGDSKVVDDNGNPMVMYHGTQEDIKVFDREAKGKFDAGWLGRGSYFSSNPETASYYASSRAAGFSGPNVIPVYISLQNPLMLKMDDVSGSKSQIMANALGISIRGLNATEQDARELRDAAIAQGYDGVILQYKRSYSNIGLEPDIPTDVIQGVDYGEREVVAFHPEQIKSVFNERPTSAPEIMRARPRVTEARRDIAAVAILNKAKENLKAVLDSVPKDKTKWTAEQQQAVADARREMMSAIRGLKRKPSAADAASLAYGMGRREGQVGGMIQGRKEGVREEAKRQRAEAIASRQKIRESYRNRVAALMDRIEAAAETNADLRDRIARMRRAEAARRDVAAEKAARKVIKAWFAGQSKGSNAGFEEAKRFMVEIRREAAKAIATLPRKLRGNYINAVATMRSPVGIDKISRRIIRDMAMAESMETVADINQMIKRVKKVGLRANTRTAILADLMAARSMLAIGKKRMIPFTNTADVAARTAAARSLLESAAAEFEQERFEYRNERNDRAIEAALDSIALGTALASLPAMTRGRLGSVAPKAGPLARILGMHTNADIYTIMQATEGGQNGVLGKIWSGVAAAKGKMTLQRKGIDEQIDAALRKAGYAGYDGYATRASGIYGESAADTVEIMAGGQRMTVTVDQMLNIAAMDDQTIELLTDATDPAGDGAGIVFSTDRYATPIKITQQEVAQIKADLSDAHRTLIDDIKNIIDTEIRPKAFEIHFQIHGRQPDIVPGYFPRKRLGDEIDQAIDPNMQPSAVVTQMLSNAGFMQQRVAGRSTMVIGGMMRTVDSHLDESLRLIHLSLPLRHALTVLKSVQVRSGIESAMGSGANDNIRKLLLNGVGLSGKPQGGLIEALNANVSGALITLNPKTWLRQLGGVFRLASELPAGSWSAGVASLMTMTPNARAEMARRIESINGYFYDRHRRSQVGIFANVLGDPNTAKQRWGAALESSARSLAAVGEAAAAGRMNDAARAVRDSVIPISRVLKSADGVLRMIDRQIMLAAFVSARADVLKRNPTMTAAEADLAAASIAEQAFRRTQNVSDSLDDTVFAAQQKFSQGLGRLMFPFSSDPLKGYNQVRRAAASRDPSLMAKTAFGVGGNIALAAAVNPVWTAAGLALASAFGLGGDDDDEELIRKMAMEREMSYLLPRVAGDAATSAFGYLGMTADGIINGAIGSPERADDVLEPLVVRFLGDTTQYLAKGEISDAGATALQLTGLPVVAPISTVTGVLGKANPSERKLLEYYRKLDKAGELSPKQRQRMNVLATRERLRLRQQRMERELAK